MKWREFSDRFLVVRKCAGCGEILPYERCYEAFCTTCQLRWRVAKTENCENCFRPAFECTCSPKGLSATGALCLRKLIFYRAERSREAENQLIYGMKHRPNRRKADFVAEELSEAVREELSILGVTEPERDAVIVSIPRGQKARIRYGFDQSELISRSLSKKTGIPYVTAIGRRRGGKEQKKLSRDHRFRNIRHLFRLRDRNAVCGKCVLLFDDVVTSGASMAAGVNLLREAGANCVICLCIAQD